jgi:Fe-S cluster biogenesis protein NfuA
VEEAISQIRPAIRDDGGDVEVVDVSPAGRVTLRFKGACMACPSRDMTLQSGIERHLKAHVPEITDVIEG